MKRILLLLLTILLVGCESKEEVQSDIEKLQTQRVILEDIMVGMNNHIGELRGDIKLLKQDKRVMEMYRDGETPRYIVTFELKQSHFSLDVTEHMKDGMNKIKFDLPVDKTFYDSVTVGEKMIEEFRGGSFLMKGSLGSWIMHVRGKKIIKD